MGTSISVITDNWGVNTSTNAITSVSSTGIGIVTINRVVVDTTLLRIAGIYRASIMIIAVYGLMMATISLGTAVSGTFIVIIARYERVMTTTKGITDVVSTGVIIIAYNIHMFTSIGLIAGIFGTFIIIVTVNCIGSTTNFWITTIRDTGRTTMADNRIILTTF
jgi:hypothetical protein